jgi:nucleoside-diphosphate-sugar epimerase
VNLVTGATGLLGSHIVEQLVKRGRPVRALVRRSSDISWLQAQGVEFAYGDVTDKASIAKAVEGVDCIYHSAARVGDWGPWEEFVEISIDGTRNVLDVVRDCKIERLVHISSLSAYGHPNQEGQVVDESAPLGVNVNKWSYYTRAKVEAEKMVMDYFRRYNLPVTIVRPSWMYGPRDRATLPRMARMIRTGKIKLVGPGDNKLNVTYAGNVAECCILAADSPNSLGEVYAACSDGEITQKQFVDLLAKELGCPPITRSVPYKVARGAAFVLELIGHAIKQKKPPMITRYAIWLYGRRTFFTAEKARRDLGWESTVGYEEGVRIAVDWLREHEKGGTR